MSNAVTLAPSTTGLSGGDAAAPDPTAFAIRRSVPTVTAETRAAVLIEMVRVSPYRAVPVLDAGGRFLGMVTEAGLSRALLAATTSAERAQVRERPAADLLELPEWWVIPQMRASEISILLDSAGRDVLPVLGSDFHFYGLIGRGDLVQELTRHFQPPLLGGMATPLGVYLTTGRAAGGAGNLGLMLTGLALFSVQFPVVALLAYVDQHSAGDVVARMSAGLHGALAPAVISLLDGVRNALTVIAVQLPALIGLRLSPLSGVHAAEHQVVHAIERGEPLLPSAVRSMPRVHPRCGTNLVAGVILVTTIHYLTASLPGDLSYLLGGMAALVWWRSFGAWLQEHVTTRPATDAQIESALRAAREVLARDDAAGTTAAAYARPARRSFDRLWRMGLLQILLGFGIGIAIVALLSCLSPSLGAILKPVIHELLTS